MANVFNGFGSGTFPRYNWTLDPSDRTGYNVYWSITQLAGQAPSGLDAVRMDEIGVAGGGPLEESSGWWTKTGLTPPSQGALWSVKFRFKLNGAQSWVVGQDSSNAVIKAVVLGDGGSPERMMTHMRAAPTSSQINIAAGVNTGHSPPEGTGWVASLSTDVWHAAQVVYDSSSTASATDGVIKLYLDNDIEASPNGVSNGVAIDVSGWNQSTRFGAGTLKAILSGENFSVIWADFMIDDVFDSTWYASMTPATARGTAVPLMAGIF